MVEVKQYGTIHVSGQDTPGVGFFGILFPQIFVWTI